MKEDQTIVIKFTVRADKCDNRDEVEEMAEDLMIHVLDTYNDDHSILIASDITETYFNLWKQVKK